MSLNIVLAASLMATISCSDSGKSNPRSSEPTLSGFWKSECVPNLALAGDPSMYTLFEITDTTLSRSTVYFNTADCTGPAMIQPDFSGPFSLGDVVSQSPWTQEVDYTEVCNTFYSTFKYESGKLYIAPGDMGNTEDARYTDFTNADSYTPIAAEDIPENTEPVKAAPKFCLQ